MPPKRKRNIAHPAASVKRKKPSQRKKVSKKKAKKSAKKVTRKPVARPKSQPTARKPVTRKKSAKKAIAKKAVKRKPTPSVKPQVSTRKPRKPKAVSPPKKRARPRRLTKAEKSLIEQQLAAVRRIRELELQIEKQRQSNEAQELEILGLRRIIINGSRLRWKYVSPEDLPRAMGVADYHTLITGVSPDGFYRDAGVFQSTHPGHRRALLRARMFGAYYSRLPAHVKAQLPGEKAWLAQFFEAEELNPDANPMALVDWASKVLSLSHNFLITFILSPNLDDSEPD